MMLGGEVEAYAEDALIALYAFKRSLQRCSRDIWTGALDRFSEQHADVVVLRDPPMAGFRIVIVPGLECLTELFDGFVARVFRRKRIPDREGGCGKIGSIDRRRTAD